MTNLDIIKYLVTNNPTRLAELLEDIYNDAYIAGYNDNWDAKPDFTQWLSVDNPTEEEIIIEYPKTKPMPRFGIY